VNNDEVMSSDSSEFDDATQIQEEGKNCSKRHLFS